MSGSNEIVSSLTVDDMNYYVDVKTTNASLSPQKGFHAHGKPEHGRVGIFNQGATCYLNTLLQCLFNDIAFRATIYNAQEDHPLLNELKRFFTFLEYSEASAVSSNDLMASFGWSKSQAHEQHDVVELFCILLDSLSQVSPALDEAIKKIFQGQQKNVLVCSNCSHQSETKSPFLNLSIELPDSLEMPSGTEESNANGNSAITLTSLFQQHLKPETLSEDNKWTCSQCSQNVQAVTSHSYDELPDQLVIHLKRFRFDPTTRKRRKLTTSVLFPEKLSSSVLIPNAASHDEYEISSVLVHTGTAMGGHYRAFIHDTPKNQLSNRSADNDRRWYDYNDASVSELTPSEAAAYFHDPIAELPTPAKVKRGISETLPPLSPRKGETPVLSYRGLVHENAYVLIYQRKQPKNVVSLPNDLISSNQLIQKYHTEVEKSNDQIRQLKRINTVQRQVIDMSIFIEYKGSMTKDQLVAAISSIPSSTSTISYDSNVSFAYCLGKMSYYDMSPSSRPLIKMSCVFDNRIIFHSINDIIYHHLTSHNLLQVMISSDSIVNISESNVRLRQYYETSQRCGETYTNRMETSLKEIFDGEYGYYSRPMTLYLETRLENDSAFQEYNPKDVMIDIILWDHVVDVIGAQKIQDNSIESNDQTIISSLKDRHKLPRKTIIVPGEDLATVDGLRQTILESFGKKDMVMKMTLLHSNSYSKRIDVIDLVNLNSTLRRDCNVWAGDEVVVEFIDSSESAGKALSVLKKLHDTESTSKQNILLYFNDPQSSSSNDSTTIGSNNTRVKGIMTSYDLSLEVLGHITLQVVKEKIAEIVGIKDTNTFYLRRSSNGPQLKDLSMTVADAGLVTMSVLHIEMGKGCDVGEYFLSFDVEISSDKIPNNQVKSRVDHISLKNLAVNEKLTVLQLKETILSSWDEIASPNVPKPLTANHMRLRDGKSTTSISTTSSNGNGNGNTITSIATLLRDDRVLIRCLLGLSDGRKIIIQVLDEPEVLSIDDMVLTLINCNYTSRSIATPIDIPLKRTITISDFYQLLSKRYHELFGNHIPSDDAATGSDSIIDKIELAKLLSSGPPLSLKTANKLKWINLGASIKSEGSENYDITTSCIDRPPLTLRDGSIIAIRHKVDYDTAKAAALAKRSNDSKEFDESTVPIVAGGGMNVVKARANIAQIRAMSSQGKRNRGGKEGVKIEVFAKNGNATVASNE